MMKSDDLNESKWLNEFDIWDKRRQIFMNSNPCLEAYLEAKRSSQVEIDLLNGALSREAEITDRLLSDVEKRDRLLKRAKHVIDLIEPFSVSSELEVLIDQWLSDYAKLKTD